MKNTPILKNVSEKDNFILKNYESLQRSLRDIDQLNEDKDNKLTKLKVEMLDKCLENVESLYSQSLTADSEGLRIGLSKELLEIKGSVEQLKMIVKLPNKETVLSRLKKHLNFGNESSIKPKL